MARINNPEYQRDYYLKNRKKLRERRRERYRTDASYRQAIRQRAVIKAAMQSLRAKRRPAPRVLHGNRQESVYHLNEVEEVINRDKDCLYNWQRGDPSLLPPALYEDARGRRMYSDSQIKFIAKLVHRLDTGQLRITYRDMRRILQEVWSERFSELRLTKAIGEVLHGKYYQKDREEARKRKEEGRRKKHKSPEVRTKGELAEM